jgi:hypothetical protein
MYRPEGLTTVGNGKLTHFPPCALCTRNNVPDGAAGHLPVSLTTSIMATPPSTAACRLIRGRRGRPELAVVSADGVGAEVGGELGDGEDALTPGPDGAGVGACDVDAI